jgi:hypothetical protein
MPRQILTIELDGLLAGDYLAHLSDPEPAALGHGLRSVAVRAEPLGSTVEAVLAWDGPSPAPRVAARAAGLPLVAEVVSVTARELDAVPAARRKEAHAPGRLSAFVDRAAAQLATQVRPAPAQPLLLRWA